MIIAQSRDIRPRLIYSIVGVGVLILLFAIDAMTNALDTQRYRWDFVYYMAMAKDGFDTPDLVAPAAYRYMTPFLAGLLYRWFDLGIDQAFKILAYIGLWFELFGTFVLVHRYSRSYSGAIVGTATVAFSAINVKFLLFDPFRPDIFGYAFVLLGIYLAFEKRVYALLCVSAIGIQFREYAVVSLVALMTSWFVRREWKPIRRYIGWFVVMFVVAVIVPRHMIQVTQNFQYVQHLEHLWRIPMQWFRDINWIYTIVIYFLPTFLLITPTRWRFMRSHLTDKRYSVLLWYTFWVAVLSMYGGTDLARFSTYFFIAQALAVGFFVRCAHPLEWIYVTVATFWFNKIHTDLPIWNFAEMLDWYGGYDGYITAGTYWHIYTEAALIAGAWVLRWILHRMKRLPCV